MRIAAKDKGGFKYCSWYHTGRPDSISPQKKAAECLDKLIGDLQSDADKFKTEFRYYRIAETPIGIDGFSYKIQLAHSLLEESAKRNIHAYVEYGSNVDLSKTKRDDYKPSLLYMRVLKENEIEIEKKGNKGETYILVKFDDEKVISEFAEKRKKALKKKSKK